mmetsp:Transcript_2087/g.4749  ORF Transcript_2087/g.4749 Transcript_2087/m.4749 type:complete len:231 (-) Transcript_2087:471-1163(-)
MGEVDATEDTPLLVLDLLVLLHQRLPGDFDCICDADELRCGGGTRSLAIGQCHLDVLRSFLGIASEAKWSLDEGARVLEVHRAKLTTDLLLRLKKPELPQLTPGVGHDGDHHIFHAARARSRQVLGSMKFEHAAHTVVYIIQLVVGQVLRSNHPAQTHRIHDGACGLGRSVGRARGWQLTHVGILYDAELDSANHRAIPTYLVGPSLLRAWVHPIDLARSNNASSHDSGE